MEKLTQTAFALVARDRVIADGPVICASMSYMCLPIS
jgi:hypothetical protein